MNGQGFFVAITASGVRDKAAWERVGVLWPEWWTRNHAHRDEVLAPVVAQRNDLCRVGAGTFEMGSVHLGMLAASVSGTDGLRHGLTRCTHCRHGLA